MTIYLLIRCSGFLGWHIILLLQLQVQFLFKNISNNISNLTKVQKRKFTIRQKYIKSYSWNQFFFFFYSNLITQYLKETLPKFKVNEFFFHLHWYLNPFNGNGKNSLTFQYCCEAELRSLKDSHLGNSLDKFNIFTPFYYERSWQLE